MNTNHDADSRSTERNVGIDVGKATLDIAILELQTHWQVPNNEDGIRELVRQLKRYKLTRIMVEATGGYERALAEACVAKNLPVIIVQPLRVRQFARAEGLLAKTDKIDAFLLARMGKRMALEPRALPDKKVQKVRDLLARRRQLMDQRTQELNRNQKATGFMQRSHQRELRMLDKEIPGSISTWPTQWQMSKSGRRPTTLSRLSPA